MNLTTTAFASRLATDEAGTSTLEYALVAGLVIVGCIGVIALLGTRVKNGWTYISGMMR